MNGCLRDCVNARTGVTRRASDFCNAEVDGVGLGRPLAGMVWLQNVPDRRSALGHLKEFNQIA
jgi:hypothetical protein